MNLQTFEYFPASYSPTSSYLTKSSKCRSFINRFYFSKAARIFFAIQILLCLFSMIWVLAHIGSFPEEIWFITLEVIIGSTIISEVMIRMYLLGFKKFFIGCNNICDITLSLICVTEIIIAFTSRSLLDDIEGAIGIMILILRNIVIIWRVFMVINRQRRTRINSVHLEVIGVGDDEERYDKMHENLILNKESIQYIYRPKLESLKEEDEANESSVKTGSIWEGRFGK
ncbi:unnamed protein product [Blepharisma stoltei]|uniref:Hydrogen voltage-gated channel 1 n=1 Tax=Blepharisma stoltei TaxID=1481888 RepID=A0AAU9I7Q0_9CILI|nr:unnamed protein product [Blepharisma stoltei]